MRSAIVTPPISPRETSMEYEQQPIVAPQYMGPQDFMHSVNENLQFEGCEFFLLDEDAKYYELADVLLETGFLTNEEERMPTTTSTYTGSSSTLCRA